MIRLLLLLLALSPLTAEESYVDFLKKNLSILGPVGNWTQGEIEIVQDPVKAAEIAAKQGRPIGIVKQDKYLTWINDPVRFPNGSYGIYARILWTHALKNGGGCAVLPVLPDGKIALNCNYRHATRSWELELPRGALKAGETPEQAATREVQEETGLILGELRYLGSMAVDSGLTSSVIPIYFAKTRAQGKADVEESEAIASIEAFTVEELRQGLIKDSLTVNFHGTPREIPLRDPFLTFALLQAQLRNFL